MQCKKKEKSKNENHAHNRRFYAFRHSFSLKIHKIGSKCLCIFLNAFLNCKQVFNVYEIIKVIDESHGFERVLGRAKGIDITADHSLSLPL